MGQWRVARGAWLQVVIREFKQAMHKRNVPQEYVRKLFTELDVDSSGYLERNEVATL